MEMDAPRRRVRITTVLGLFSILAAPSVPASLVTATAPALPEGASWTLLELPGEALSPLPAGWDGGIFWDVRPRAAAGREAVGRAVRWTVRSPEATGLQGAASRLGADRALCADLPGENGRRLGCRLYRAGETGPAGPRLLFSEVPGDFAGPREAPPALGRDDLLAAGATFTDALALPSGARAAIRGEAVAEGVVLVPAGPREVVLLRETIDAGGETRLRYRFQSRRGLTVAVIEGPLPADGRPFVPLRGEILLDSGVDADDNIAIRYEELSEALVPGNTGFLQYSMPGGRCSTTTSQICGLDADCPGGETCEGNALSDLHPSWSTVPDMIGVDASSAIYQPDPGDPSSQQSLGEVWDFTALDLGTLQFRVFNTTRDDLVGPACPTSCSARDLGATPPDGTWQSFLKIDRFDDVGAQFSRDVFYLNDNDTGANPAIDLPYVSQDELNTDDWTQICSDDSGGGVNRLIHFFKFFGASPATADLEINDTWLSGAWTECDSTRGLHLTLESQCGHNCYPTCSGTSPFGRGRRNGAGAGIESRIVEDGWVLVPAGNYVPALLMRQITDIEAGLDFLFGICNLGTQRSYSIDYFWLHRHYGILATVSSPTDETATMPPDNWSLLGNVSDGADFTWGPFPPYQTQARACLSGTQVVWTLPADGSHLGGEPGVSDYGWVVSWGGAADPEDLADWGTNPNHSPLPGAPAYLAASAGVDPAPFVIASWGGSSINVTVTTALEYTDPDVGDTTPYRSAAFYKVVEDPARLDPGTFQVGNGVEPFVTKNGPDIELAWPAVAGASSHLVRVWDLNTGTEIPCPAGMNCTPAGSTTTHSGAVFDGKSYGYSAFAVDPCGEASVN